MNENPIDKKVQKVSETISSSISVFQLIRFLGAVIIMVGGGIAIYFLSESLETKPFSHDSDAQTAIGGVVTSIIGISVAVYCTNKIKSIRNK